jgi:hypothetical protein
MAFRGVASLLVKPLGVLLQLNQTVTEIWLARQFGCAGIHFYLFIFNKLSGAAIFSYELDERWNFSRLRVLKLILFRVTINYSSAVERPDDTDRVGREANVGGGDGVQ